MITNNEPLPPDYFDDDENDEDMEDDYYDCGMDRHGHCGKAGSEECDFECPYRNVKKN